MDSGQRIDKEEVLETDAMIAVGKLWHRTLDLEEKLRGNTLPPRSYPERLYLERLCGQVNSAAQYLRDWGFNAKADEMLSVWGDFYGTWTQPTADVSAFLRLPGLAGKFNRWLRETLERLLKVDDQPPAAGIPAAPATDQDAHSKGRKRTATAAARMIDLIRDPATHTWTAEQFRVKLGYESRSTITATPAWKQLAVARGMAALQAEEQAVKRGIGRKSDKRRRPKHRSKD